MQFALLCLDVFAAQDRIAFNLGYAQASRDGVWYLYAASPPYDEEQR
jgi:hypothetical protein